ncbi:hypothetical protein KA005_11045 [bacterium]|nr:hypothetical protein [bacterium]
MTKLKLKILGTEVEYEGNEKFLETKVLQLLEAVKKVHNEEVKNNLHEVHEDLHRNLVTLEGYSTSMSRLNEELARRMKEIYEKSVNFLESIETLAGSPADLFAATKAMKEMQISFNLQYLNLQNQMQYENRQFTMVSNIMKTKHDTAKNTINNIR